MSLSGQSIPAFSSRTPHRVGSAPASVPRPAAPAQAPAPQSTGTSLQPLQQHVSSGGESKSAVVNTRLTGAEFADITAKPGDSDVEILLSGTNFTLGMKAGFENQTYEVAVQDDGSASIHVILPDPFPATTHKVVLKDAAGADAGFQYLRNKLIPRGADLTQALSDSRTETKALKQYAKVMHDKTAAQLRVNESQRKLDSASGKIGGKSLQPKSVSSTQVENPTCKADSDLEKTNILVRRSLMSPKEVSDAFGRRLGRHYIAFEVTLRNNSDAYQYILHDVSIDLSTLMGAPQGSYEWAFSTQELSMLRGVPEKGQDYDPRNLTLHILRSIGSVAGGVTGLTGENIQDVFGGAVAGYNGPLLSSFMDIFPDHTATQLNRLSDSAFTANSVVAKRSSKVFAIFVPADLVLTNSEVKKYWRNPLDILDQKEHDFRQADVCVDGAFITEVSSLSLGSVAFADPSKAFAGASVELLVNGTNLASGDSVLHVFDQAVAIASVDAKNTGHATVTIPSSYDFKLSYAAFLESTKTGQRSATAYISANAKPVLGSLAFADPAKAVAGGTDVVILITGSHLVEGDTSLQIFSSELPVIQVSADGTSGQVKLNLPGTYLPANNVVGTLKTKAGVLSEAGVLPATSVTLAAATTSAADASGKVTVTLTGTGFLLSDTVVAFDTGSPVPLATAFVDGTTGTVVIAPLTAPWPGAHTAQLQTPKRGNSGTPPVTIK